MKPSVYTNQNEALIVWKYEKAIPGCIGFAVYKKTNDEPDTLAEPLHNRVGFPEDTYTLGDERPSTQWPIQRFMWNDFTVKTGESVQYMVVPMLLQNGDLVKDQNNASEWSNKQIVDTGTKYKAYFNRGLVASQFFSRANTNITEEISKISNAVNTNKNKNASPNSVFKQVITGGPSKLREYLGGCLSTALFALLDDAKKSDKTIYAALYELKLDDLTDRLIDLGERANVILANGTGKEPGTKVLPSDFKEEKDDNPTDENIVARHKLKKSKVHVFDRMVVASTHFAHNKFVVICDRNGKAEKVLTGTTNWTADGVFAQVNNSIVIDDAKLANEYLEEWAQIKSAGNDYPPGLYTYNETPKKSSDDLYAWFNPLKKLSDLSDIEAMLKAAKKGFLFLLFNPGPKNTVFNTILNLIQTRDDLYIRGIMNQDPGGGSKNGNPLIFFDLKDKKATNWDVLLPKTIRDPFSFWYQDVSDGLVTIHSKSFVLDPFGDNPIVITGSNNGGPKASGKNDDNFVVIKGDKKLAAEFATNILSVYSHYHWRYSLANKASNDYNGLSKSPDWMKNSMNENLNKQLNFLLC